MNPAIQDFIQGKRIAVMGASRSGKKFGNIALAEMKKRGYQMFVVHPQAQEIDGERCYPNLASLQGQVDGVFISLPPQQAAQALRDAASAGIKNIWMQAGAQSSETATVARELGVNPVTGKCILMYAPPVRSAHKLHRIVTQLCGQL